MMSKDTKMATMTMTKMPASDVYGRWLWPRQSSMWSQAERCTSFSRVGRTCQSENGDSRGTFVGIEG